MSKHEIYFQPDTQQWIRANADAIFRPKEVIPAFEEFKNDLLEFEVEDYEYEDLVFLPILGHYLSLIPEFRGPKLVALVLHFSEKSRQWASILENEQTMGLSAPCFHKVGVSLDGEDAADTAELLAIAQERAQRVAEIFSWDYSSSEKTYEIAESLGHQELVDIFIYSILESEDFPEIPLYSWSIEQAQKSLDYVERQWRGEPLTYGQVINGVPEFMYNPSFTGSIDDQQLFLLTDKETGKPQALCCESGENLYVRVADRWGAIPDLEHYKSHYDFKLVNKHPAVRYELIDMWDLAQIEEVDIEKYLDSSQNKPNTESPSWQDPLTDEQREQFYANWAETMPEVLTWTDDEIKMGLAQGM